MFGTVIIILKHGAAMGLEDYYSGDAAFHQYALAVEPEWAGCSLKEQLLAAVAGDKDLAVAIHYHFGARALEWFNEVGPALDGLTPNQCLQTDWGKKRLKESLIRMP